MDQLCVQQTNPCGMHAPCQRDDESRPPGPCRVVVVVCRASRIGYTAGHNRPVAKQPTLPVVSQTMKARTVIRWCIYIHSCALNSDAKHAQQHRSSAGQQTPKAARTGPGTRFNSVSNGFKLSQLVRTKRKLMHSISSPAISLCYGKSPAQYDEQVIIVSIHYATKSSRDTNP
jgi:hypothetical protein